MRSRQPWKINKDLLIYKTFYFFYFGALGAINPFLPVYLRQIGLSAFAVGLLVGVRPIAQLATAPFWTVIADKFKKRKAILIMSIMAWLIMTIALVFVEPTEEICEYTAKNSSHNVFVNYTKHKTGFFKRSTKRPAALPVRLETKSRQTNKELFHDSHKKKRAADTKLFAEHKDQTKLKNMLLKTEDKKERLAGKSKNITVAQNVSSTSKIDSLTVSSSGDFQTLVEGSTDRQHEIFDPFNMNGKSKSSAGADLAKFFATTHNHMSHKSTDVHYYNMNRAENQTVQSQHKAQHLLKIKNKHRKKYHGSNQTLKATKVTGDRKKTGIGLEANETIKVIQTNLFKSNRNEMKRLFVILLVLIVVGEFLETPSAPLSDASLLEYLGENRIHYGKQRLWGSLGHGIASFLVGILMERSRHLTCGEEFIDYTTSFSVFTVFMLITLVISANFEFRYKDVEEADNSVFATVLTVHYISFLTAVCYMGMCHGLLHNFLMWFLEDLGGSKTLMGLAICSRNSADLIMFFIVSKLIEIFGQIKIAFIALISYGTIFIAYSTMSNPWFAIGVEFLGGFTFAASWTACTSYLAEAAPQESVTTMQGEKLNLKEILLHSLLFRSVGLHAYLGKLKNITFPINVFELAKDSLKKFDNAPSLEVEWNQ